MERACFAAGSKTEFLDILFLAPAAIPAEQALPEGIVISA
jgi:hypothetical protein